MGINDRVDRLKSVQRQQASQARQHARWEADRQKAEQTPYRQVSREERQGYKEEQRRLKTCAEGVIARSQVPQMFYEIAHRHLLLRKHRVVKSIGETSIVTLAWGNFKRDFFGGGFKTGRENNGYVPLRYSFLRATYRNIYSPTPIVAINGQEFTADLWFKEGTEGNGSYYIAQPADRLKPDEHATFRPETIQRIEETVANYFLSPDFFVTPHPSGYDPYAWKTQT